MNVSELLKFVTTTLIVPILKGLILVNVQEDTWETERPAVQVLPNQRSRYHVYVANRY